MTRADYAFTTSELNQIATLVREWSSGRILPIDSRHYTKKVRQYAERQHLLDRRADGRLVCGAGSFNPCTDLPIETLWRLAEPLLKGQRSRGRSITADPLWLTLNIYPEGHRYASNASLEAQIDILDTLAQHGHLIVQRAGSVWEITRMRDAPGWAKP